MAVNYIDTLKTNRMQLVADLIASKVAAPSTGSALAGQLVIGTSALSGATGVLATLALDPIPLVVSTPVAGTVVATLDCTPPLSVAASASGTAAKAEFRNNAGAKNCRWPDRRHFRHRHHSRHHHGDDRRYGNDHRWRNYTWLAHHDPADRAHIQRRAGI